VGAYPEWWVRQGQRADIGATLRDKQGFLVKVHRDPLYAKPVAGWRYHRPVQWPTTQSEQSPVPTVTNTWRGAAILWAIAALLTLALLLIT
jgi:hypothetical protein